MNSRKYLRLLMLVLLALTSTTAAKAQNDQGFLVHRADQLVWKPASAALPPGAQVAVLRGDPAKPGLFTMRLKFPAGYVVNPHWHTQDEHITVISGELKIGMGDKASRPETQSILPGSLMVMPATHRHFAYFDKETVLQLHGIAPWVVNYVSPKDDPRNK